MSCCEISPLPISKDWMCLIRFIRSNSPLFSIRHFLQIQLTSLLLNLRCRTLHVQHACDWHSSRQQCQNRQFYLNLRPCLASVKVYPFLFYCFKIEGVFLNIDSRCEPFGTAACMFVRHTNHLLTSVHSTVFKLTYIYVWHPSLEGSVRDSRRRETAPAVVCMTSATL